MLDPAAVRVFFEPPGRGSHIHFHHLFDLYPIQGARRFSVSSLGDLLDGNGAPFVGVLPLFFRIWTTGKPPAPGFGRSPFPQAAGMPTMPQPNQPFHPPGRQPVGAGAMPRLRVIILPDG